MWKWWIGLILLLWLLVVVVNKVTDTHLAENLERERVQLSILLKKHGAPYAFQCRPGSSNYCYYNERGQLCRLKSIPKK